ncbi:predicted protein [Sclerotinia sclerotiorum 1980 UF-70]|uniref:Uncharacterized protein n=1 Tax=Sclerotinia sclerotiorum (strain ATCC 18683 / 1980 / Ss-1) TaxID=665079 RepID=A7E5V8_SCLS1|nr:predicted protein [Sclerotinia sclerotiorum 1980 UF-70]EDN91280.1 predicted protein [Sclerotinia sclerotiorum 1980 UF-70]
MSGIAVSLCKTIESTLKVTDWARHRTRRKFPERNGYCATFGMQGVKEFDAKPSRKSKEIHFPFSTIHYPPFQHTVIEILHHSDAKTIRFPVVPSNTYCVHRYPFKLDWVITACLNHHDMKQDFHYIPTAPESSKASPTLEVTQEVPQIRFDTQF